MKKSFTYFLSWLGLFGIITTQAFVIFSSPNNLIWPIFVLFMALLPISGFWQNKRYTFQWTGFLSLFFLCVGVSEFFVIATPQSFSFVLLISSVALYFGVVFHAKQLAYLERINAQTKE